MKTPIVLFPGLGADSNLFFEQKKYFGDNLITPDWISPKRGETITQFCQRFAEDLSNHKLSNLSEAFLGGFSFGGMIALELASILSAQNRLKVKGVILISAGRTEKILKSLFKIQARVGSLLPDFLLMSILENQMLKKFLKDEPLSSEQANALERMVESLDLDFFRWSLRACSQWNPRDRFLMSGEGFPIFEIQGEKDEIIPQSREEGVITLRQAKHLIHYTHAKEVNRWLEQITQNG